MRYVNDFEKIIEDFRDLLHKYERPTNQVILDEADALAYLKVSKRCLANWRAQGVIPYHKLGGRIYYIQSELLDALKAKGINTKPHPKF